MCRRNWSDGELLWLKEYEKLSNYISGEPPVMLDNGLIGWRNLLLAKLILADKPVIGYSINGTKEVSSFSDTYRSSYTWDFHPINFSSLKEYASFLEN